MLWLPLPAGFAQPDGTLIRPPFQQPDGAFLQNGGDPMYNGSLTALFRFVGAALRRQPSGVVFWRWLERQPDGVFFLLAICSGQPADPLEQVHDS